ncbi:MAG TPA: hypothetical protein VKB60_03085 [Terriglobales bacterium]|nr:hypothetical protein [Terriglobales bacterium]
MFTGESNTGHYVGGSGATRNDGGPAVNHGIGNSAGGVVAGLTWTEALTTQ